MGRAVRLIAVASRPAGRRRTWPLPPSRKFDATPDIAGTQCPFELTGMHAERENGARALPEVARAASTEPPREPRSAYGRLPGEEFPRALYRSVVASFAAIVLISWFDFGGDADAELVLGFASVLTIVFFALPILVRKTAAARSIRAPREDTDFLHSRVEIATGTISGAEA